MRRDRRSVWLALALASCVAVVTLGTCLSAAELSTPDAPVASPPSSFQIGDLTLHTAPEAVRERPGWRSPRLILLAPELREQLAALHQIAPDARFLEVNEHTPLAAVAEADVAIGICDARLIQAAAHLQWIQWMAAGVEYCLAQPVIQQRQLLVTNLQRTAASSMAEHVMGLMLMLNRHMDDYYRLQQHRHWVLDSEAAPQIADLKDETILVVGLGGIGMEVARRASAFGMRVVATRASNAGAPEYVSYVGPPGELPRLAADADFIVNCTPLTPETQGIFNKELFGLMKPTAYFVNVGRGGSVVVPDLIGAIKSKRIAGAGLDVADPEPLPASSELWRLPHVLITPHISGESANTVKLRNAVLMENLRRYVAGEPMVSVVDLQRGY
jgi:phosphoglycerate dehydrogenase-like enzyme